MSKRTLIITILVVFVFSLFFISKNFIGNMQENIYDDKDKIVSSIDSYTYINRVGSSKNRETELSFKLTGVETLWTIKSDINTNIDIDYSSNIDSGDLKLVMVSPEDNIIKIFEGSDNGTISVPIIKGKNRIRIVGRDAKGSITIEILADENLKIHSKN